MITAENMREEPGIFVNTKEKADEYFYSLWDDMQNNFSDNYLRFLGAAGLALELKIFTEEQYELWGRRVRTCPENGRHLGGRTWCAYCGEVLPDPEDD